MFVGGDVMERALNSNNANVLNGQIYVTNRKWAKCLFYICFLE